MSDFAAKAIEVQADFEKNGPGAPGINMEEGLERLEQYTVMIAGHQKRREELALAQKLFNMPIQSYPELSDVEQTLKKLQAIYDLYKEQRDTKDGWSGTLWSELDSAVLEKGMEGFEVRLKAMVRLFGQEIKADRRTGNAYKMLEEAIVGFLDSLPLIQNLKSEALRDRHWKKLMKVTGIAFDMNPKVAAPLRPAAALQRAVTASSCTATTAAAHAPVLDHPCPPTLSPLFPACFPSADLHARQALLDAAREVLRADRRPDGRGDQGADDRARHQRHR